MTPEQREQLREERRVRRTERSPRVARALPEELRPVVEQLRTNRQQASQEIRDVLTADQEARLRELAQERRAAAGERMRRGSARWQNR